MYLRGNGLMRCLAGPLALPKTIIGFFILLTALAFVACGGDDASSADAQATAVAGAIATIEAQPTSTPVVQTVVITATPGSTAIPGPTATPVVITIVQTPEPTPTPGPTATPVVITIVQTPEPTATPTPIPPPKVTTALAAVREDNSLIANVDITLDRASRAFVEYENADAGKFRTATTEAVDTKHTVPVVRLRPETTYSYTAFAVDSDGNPFEGPRGTFTTGKLPDELATINMTVQGKPTSELVLMDYTTDTNSHMVMLDDESNIVWYYTDDQTIPDRVSPILGIVQKPSHNFVFTSGSPNNPCCIKEITPLGELVDQLVENKVDGAPHHSQIILSDHEILYSADITRIIDDSPNEGEAEQAVIGDTLRIWDQETGATHEVWNAFDTWDAASPDQRDQWTGDPIRWTHFNSISLGPRGNVIISSRNRNQIISISPDYKTVEWILNGPDNEFTFLDPGDKFYRQHTASQLRNGNILLFDNGATRPEEEGGQYSRALELLADDYDMTATKVWEYRADPDIYSSFISSALRLENGNTLVNFGATPDHEIIPITIVEVDREGNEVWRLDMIDPPRAEGRSPRRFRAYGDQDTINGEVRLP